MRKQLLAICLLVLLLSCKKESKAISANTLAHAEIPKESHKELYGLWTGVLEPDYESYKGDLDTDESEFDDDYKKITIKINRITNDSVFGQSIVAGNQRPLLGTISNKEGMLFFTLKEPGNSKYDGKFELFVSNDTLQGSWVIYKLNLKTTPRKTLKLVQKQFSYNPDYMLNKEYDDEVVDWDSQKDRDTTVIYDDGEEHKFVQHI